MAEAGQSLGHYRLIEKIGEGGMGVVWKAVDTNHPSIATIHGLDEQDGMRFLAMELVAGEDMAARLERGSLPIEEALALAVQLAEALEAAHEHGVIHRDLKPANVKLTPDGKVKVLDFGLAKAFDTGSAADSASVSMSPTMTSAGTVAGIILGTAAYMSPEQAKGKPVDRRADIWAFGVVLHEMLTGNRLFHGESVSETLAAVLMAEPDMQSLPGNTPRRVRRLIERSLRKDPSSRLRDIGDARLVLEEALAGHEWKTAATAGAAEQEPRPVLRSALLLAVVGLLAGAAIGYLLRGAGSSAPPPTSARLTVATAASKNPWPFLTPDGKTFIYNDDDGALRARRLDGYEETIIRGTERARSATHSPDGKWIAFMREDRVIKVPLDGSTPAVELGRVPPSAFTLVWLSSGILVVPTPAKPYTLLRIPEDGGAPLEPVEVTLTGVGDNFFLPLEPLPDGRHILGAADSYGEGTWRMNVIAVDAETGAVSVLVEDAGFSKWSPTGHLVFARGETLFAAPFDTSGMMLRKAPVALLDGLASPVPAIGALFDIADDGTLLYRAGADATTHDRLAFLGPDGSVEVWDETERDMDVVSVSPDGRKVAVQVTNWAEGLYEIWISELDRPRLRPLVDRPELDCSSQVWAPDSESIYYTCFGAAHVGGVFRIRIDGRTEAELLLERTSEDDSFHPTSMSPDGSFLLLQRPFDAKATFVLARLGSGDPAFEQVGTFGTEVDPYWGARFSPDGRWIAYGSSKTGRMEVYIRAFGPEGTLGPETPLTTDGGSLPVWGAAGGSGDLEIAYLAADQKTIRAVTLSTATELRISVPRNWFDASDLRLQSNLSPLPDGRFLFAQGQEDAVAGGNFNVVLNWFEELKQRAPLD